MPYTRVNGVNTYYETVGDGVPVLFIHGGLGGAESTLYPKTSVFRDLLPPDRFRTIVYERRSGGRSQYIGKPYWLRDLAMDARSLLGYLGIRQAIVVGDSLGGIVAQRMALDFPDVVVSLLLMETGARFLEVPPRVSAILAATRILPMPLLFPLFRKRVLQPQFYDPLGPLSEEEIAQRRLHHEEYTQRLRALPKADLYRYSIGLLRNYDAFVNTDIREEVGTLSMPIDIMHATGDAVVPFERGLELHRLLPCSRFHRLEGLGHGLFYYPEGAALARQLIEEQARLSAQGLLLAGR